MSTHKTCDICGKTINGDWYFGVKVSIVYNEIYGMATYYSQKIECETLNDVCSGCFEDIKRLGKGKGGEQK